MNKIITIRSHKMNDMYKDERYYDICISAKNLDFSEIPTRYVHLHNSSPLCDEDRKLIDVNQIATPKPDSERLVEIDG